MIVKVKIVSEVTRIDTVKELNFGEYKLGAMKEINTDDGICYEAILCRGKKKVASCFDEGRGGEVSMNFFDKDEEVKFDDYLKNHPKVSSEYEDEDGSIKTIVLSPYSS